MAANCCYIAIVLCDPAGNRVIGFWDAETQAFDRYLNTDGSAFAGNTAALAECAGTGAVSTLTGPTTNADGSVTYTHDDGTGTTTDLTFCPGCTTAVDNGNGSVTITNPDASTVTIPAETVTAIVDNGNGSFTYTDEAGGQVTITAGGAGNTSVLTANGDGSFTHDDGTGTTVTIPAHVPSTLTANGDGSFTHDDGNGTTVTIPAEVVSTLTDNGDGSFTYTDEAGAQVTIPAPPTETTSTLTDNGNGSYTYVNETGAATTFTIPDDSTVTNNMDGTVTHVSGDGSSTILDVCAIVRDGGCLPTIVPGPSVNEYTFDDGYGNTSVILVNEIDMDINQVDINGSRLIFTATNGTQIIADICSMVALNCNATLVANADGTYTHTSNDGTTTNLPAEVVTTFVDNGNGTYTYTSEDGTETTTVAPGAETVTTLVINGDGSATYTNEAGATTVLPADTVTTLVDNGNGTYTYTNEAGAQTTIPAGNTSSLTANGDGSFTHNDGAGTTVTIPAHVPSTLTDNGDGTWTHDDGNGTTVTITVPAHTPSTLTDNGDGTLTHDDGNGTTVSFDVCAAIAANCNSPMVVGGDGSVTYTDNAGTVTTIPAPPVSTVTNNANGTVTHDPGDGTPATVLDVCAIVQTTQRLARLDEGLRQKGLHAPITGPFKPADGVSRWAIETALAEFAENRTPVQASRLKVKIAGDHVVLAPSRFCPVLSETVAELRAVLAPLIDPVGVPLIRGFGLPLSGRLSPEHAETVCQALAEVFEPLMRDRPLMTNIALSASLGPSRPWQVVSRHAFSALEKGPSGRVDALACAGPTLLSAVLFGERVDGVAEALSG